MSALLEKVAAVTRALEDLTPDLEGIVSVGEDRAHGLLGERAGALIRNASVTLGSIRDLTRRLHELRQRLELAPMTKRDAPLGGAGRTYGRGGMAPRHLL